MTLARLMTLLLLGVLGLAYVAMCLGFDPFRWAANP